MPNWGGAASGALAGAGSGAALGSFVPGIGTAIGAGGGAIVGGLTGLFGGGGGKDDDDDELNNLIASLKTSADASKRKGDALSAMGTEQLQPVLSYLKKLVGGDPNELMAATRPERTRVIDQYDTARKTISEFGGRGGGSNAAFAGTATDQANTLSNITSDARTNAVNTAGQMGLQLEGLGLTADQLANADVNTIVNAILNKKGFDLTESGQNKQMAAGLAEGLGTLIGLYLTRGKKAGA